MHLNGIPDTIIKKMGRWSSDMFLIYIQEQLSIFSKNVASAMSRKIPFHNTRPPVCPVKIFN